MQKFLNFLHIEAQTSQPHIRVQTPQLVRISICKKNKIYSLET